MIYVADSHFDLMRNTFRLRVKRADMRTRGLELLKWEWVAYENGELCADGASLDLDEHEHSALLQSFLDLAWSRGLRPAHYDEPKETTALKAHLEDMRCLVFEKKPKVGVE